MLSTDEKIDRIYDKIDRLLYEGKFDIVDKILYNITTTYLCTDLLISLLTITLSAKHKLKHRLVLYKEIQDNITRSYGLIYCQKLMNGLY